MRRGLARLHARLDGGSRRNRCLRRCRRACRDVHDRSRARRLGAAAVARTQHGRAEPTVLGRVFGGRHAHELALLAHPQLQLLLVRAVDGHLDVHRRALERVHRLEHAREDHVRWDLAQAGDDSDKQPRVDAAPGFAEEDGVHGEGREAAGEEHEDALRPRVANEVIRGRRNRRDPLVRAAQPASVRDEQRPPPRLLGARTLLVDDYAAQQRRRLERLVHAGLERQAAVDGKIDDVAHLASGPDRLARLVELHVDVVNVVAGLNRTGHQELGAACGANLVAAAPLTFAQV
mmetsp:Transcript_3143/g.11268  ORF Transcript_3143/g.11268 Transcript_3143/m.11268 type:complete len:290 (+) Transcript_3143:1674-2543(+)